MDSAGPPDVILDLESPLKASRRARSLHQAGTAVMQDTNAFAEEEEPATPKGAKLQFPVRAQVGPQQHSLFSLHSSDPREDMTLQSTDFAKL